MTRFMFLLLAASAALVGIGDAAGAALFTPPQPLDFGSVAVGTTSAGQQLSIQGLETPAGGQRTITGVALVPGSPFAIADTDCNDTPSPSQCHVTVTFIPAGPGPATGTLTGNEVDPRSGVSTAFTYELTGVGTAPPPVLPEAPDPRLLPVVAAALFGASFLIVRRRATASSERSSA
jgi:hypothetical protein